MRSLLLISLTFLLSLSALGQKKILDHPDFDIWNRIQNSSISNDGKFIMYSLQKGEKDSHLKIKDGNSQLIFEHERGERGQFTFDSQFAVFTLKAWEDSVKEMKRRKVKKNELPKDSLAIYSLPGKQLVKIGNIQSYKLPEKWSSHLAYQLTEIKEEKKEENGDDEKEKKPKKKGKKVGRENGYHLVLRNLATGSQDTIKYVKDYVFAKEGKRLAYVTTGMDSTIEAGVYVTNLEAIQTTNVLTAKEGKYYNLGFSDSGKHFGFVADLDTTKALVRPNELYYYAEGATAAMKLVDAGTAPEGYRVSSDSDLSFSKDESKLFFGLATPPILQDTTLLEEEIVNVEVWTYDEPQLYTVQELQVKNEQKRSYLSVIHLDSKKLVQIATVEFPEAELGEEGNAGVVLVETNKPYLIQQQHDVQIPSDYAIVNATTGEHKLALQKVAGRVSLSPKAKYVYGYDLIDSTWFTYNIASGKLTRLTEGKAFYNELNDAPQHPYPYNAAGWTENDASLLIYDRYDIWEFNPEDANGKRLTKGREAKVRYRYNRLDDEERFIDRKGKWLLSTFNESNKNAGFYEFNGKNNKGKQLVDAPYAYGRPQKAQAGKNIIFTRQSFIDFPDIHYTDLGFKSSKKISTANPQQAEYNWGTAELVHWNSLDGIPLQGMLIKPENFDPNKKYPMIVNFYEKSADGLHRHRAPTAGRSTISYSFYTSRGYVIFNPDVHYRIGYPGESAYNCVIPGVTKLIETGYIDKDNIGVQGHSWGGYQIAYLVTKTDIFKAAESGAPVPNMISAYGGIRWWTGLSRQFQYEHTQSRIGGTPWDYPVRFIENSPIFFIDKINTPLLIMHNDADGHVPWYQGIEFFMALRRLGKPAWFLNYNGEPHWPLKFQNRKDFNIRMQQFFDHYLQGAPKPVWMERGVPAIEKGINQGYELTK
jgi:dipeptidyl aminopeptidase/acylaminoacyl peptidase